MDTKEMIAVMQAYDGGKKILYRRKGFEHWSSANSPNWDWGTYEYKVAPHRPSIDWSAVRHDYNWLAVDSNGAAYLYKEEPHMNTNYWDTEFGQVRNANVFASLNIPDGFDWKDSLVQRP